MKASFTSRISSQSGYSLVTTMILVGLASALLAASLSRTLTVSRLNDRSNAYLSANAVAEAATEKVLSQMMSDFTYGGDVVLTRNLATYQTGLLPGATDSTVFADYAFSDGQGGTNCTYVARTTTNANAPYVYLLSQYPGLQGFASTYRVVSNVRPLTGDYGFTGAVQQDVQMAQIPIFQFAIFYNSLLEFTWAAPLTVKGRVHCNTNIYVGSSADLDFNYTVTTAGVITNPAWGGHSQPQYTGAINYNGNPGFGTHEPVMTLPIGTNGNDPNAVRQIIYPPPPGETATNPISIQRYYNQAYMLVAVSNSMVTLTVKNSMYDPSPLILSNGPPNTAAATNWTNINAWNISSWLSTNTTFYDERENCNNHTVQIDVARLASWIGGTNGATNSILRSNKWVGNVQFNGVLYVADWRDTNSQWMDCVRLTNGVNVTNGLYNTGLTVATPNPLYVMGDYNCPNPAYLGTTNTTLSRPCSFACDALTILSAAWADSKSALGYGSRNNASSTTVDAAILAGIVFSTGSSGTQFSGGVVNLPRLLENWSTGSTTLTLDTSMVCLYNSVQATTQFVMPGTYYNAPTQRNFWFDQNFTLPGGTGLPPGTPKIDQMIRAAWCNPPPGTVTYNPSPTLDYVAR